MNQKAIIYGLVVASLVMAPCSSEARWLNPNTGRFQTRDTYEGNSEDPSSLHKYLYGADNPVNIVDPSGELAEDIVITLEINEDLESRDLQRVNSQAAIARQRIANTVALVALIAIETMPLGEVQPTPKPVTAPPKPGDEDQNKQSLFRGMIEEGARPKVGDSARMLGIRPGLDIPLGPGNRVAPQTGGMSVAPKTPMNLPVFRRPQILLGTGKDPVWGIHASMLGPQLRFHQDSPTHGVIEPSMSMSLDAYKKALADTKETWIKVAPGN